MSLTALFSILIAIHFQICERSIGASSRNPCLENSCMVFLSGWASKTSMTCRISFWTWWSSRLKLGTSSSLSWWVYMPVDSKKSILILKFRTVVIIIICKGKTCIIRRRSNRICFFLIGRFEVGSWCLGRCRIHVFRGIRLTGGGRGGRMGCGF